ncbi:uncharacterized protein LOC135498665 [Lineus longissimus]|uniref:uncharacterized protein LOC135498665 n=1 Tax=Lineus longissimus TaxID=88925 RepID=UPI00315DC88E
MALRCCDNNPMCVYVKVTNSFEILTTLKFSNRSKEVMRRGITGDFITTNTSKFATAPAKVIILTYMRSGSTLLGEVFNSDPHAFYWYEPVRAVYGGLYEKVVREPQSLVDQLEISNRYMSRFEKDKLMTFINDLYGCDTAKWPDEFLAWYDLLEMNTLLLKAARCAHRTRAEGYGSFRCIVDTVKGIESNTVPDIMQAYWLLRMKGAHTQSMNYTTKEELLLRASLGSDSAVANSTIEKLKDIMKCYKKIGTKLRPCLESVGVKQACEKTKIRAIKTIRMQMDFVGEFFDLDPDVKVVHLLRDPRGVANSRSKLGLLRPKGSVELDAKVLCNKILRDLAVKKELMREFPGRIFTIRYEDFVADTDNAINALYNFLGTTRTKEAYEAFIIRTTAKSLDPYSPSRESPKAVAEAWRKQLTGADRRSVDAQCSKVYDFLGYRI